MSRRLLAAALSLAAWAAPAAAGHAAAGALKADAEGCLECHAPERAPNAAVQRAGAFPPRLEGQHAAYLLKQFRDFRSGARRSDTMGPMARTVDDATLADIVAWFASLPPSRGGGGGAGTAATMFRQGDAARGIAACAGCHGDAAQGQPAIGAPRLAGQHAAYLSHQLQAFADGTRRSPAQPAMARSAASLSAAEVAALAAYLEGL